MNPVTEFENKIAEFFGAPYAVTTDSCTSGLELCLRYTEATYIECPKRTYLSVPMLANKLKIGLFWKDEDWKDYYHLTRNVIDAAVLWKRNSYIPETYMCLSFQYQKHLSIGRCGAILCSNKEAANTLRMLRHDGRVPEIPWRAQNIRMMGYHFYITQETAQIGLDKLQNAIDTPPRKWVITDWPDLTQMDVFKNTI